MSGLLAQLLKFSLVGVLNTFVGLLVIWALTLSDVSPYLANAGGYLAGLAVSFFLNRSWTFAVEDGWPVLRYIACFCVCFCVNLLVLTAGLNLTSLSVYLVQGGAVVSYSLLFFVLCRVFVFRRTLA